jgi:hypothetical protein
MEQIVGSLLIGNHYTSRAIDALILISGIALLVGGIIRWRVGARSRTASSSPHPLPNAYPAPSTQPTTSWSSDDFFGGTTVTPSTGGLAPATAASVPSPGFTRWAPPTQPPTQIAAARPPRRPLGSIVMMAVGAILLAVGLDAVVPDVADAMTTHTVMLPDQTQTLTKLPMPAALQSAADQFSSSLPNDIDIGGLQLALYGKGSSQTPYAVAVLANVKGTPNVGREFASLSDGTDGPVTLTKVVDPGLPGELRCGTMPSGATALNTCAWIDDDTMGFLIAVDPHLTPSQMAALGVEFRAAAEQ